MVIAVVIGAGLVGVAAVGHVRLGRIVERAAGRLTRRLVRVEELPNVRMASSAAAVLRLLLLLRLNSAAHHGRTVWMRDAAQKSRGRRELVNQLEHGPVLLLLLLLLLVVLLQLVLALKFLRMLELVLFHRRHLRRGK